MTAAKLSACADARSKHVLTTSCREKLYQKRRHDPDQFARANSWHGQGALLPSPTRAVRTTFTLIIMAAPSDHSRCWLVISFFSRVSRSWNASGNALDASFAFLPPNRSKTLCEASFAAAETGQPTLLPTTPPIESPTVLVHLVEASLRRRTPRRPARRQRAQEVQEALLAPPRRRPGIVHQRRAHAPDDLLAAGVGGHCVRRNPVVSLRALLGGWEHGDPHAQVQYVPWGA